MSSIADDLSVALEELEGVLPGHYFEYRGATFRFIPDVDSEGSTLAVGGFNEDVEKTITARKNQFPIKSADNALLTVDLDTLLSDSDNLPPHVGKRIRLAQVDYRIVSKQLNPAGVAWVLGLGSVNR